MHDSWRHFLIEGQFSLFGQSLLFLFPFKTVLLSQLHTLHSIVGNRIHLFIHSMVCLCPLLQVTHPHNHQHHRIHKAQEQHTSTVSSALSNSFTLCSLPSDLSHGMVYRGDQVGGYADQSLAIPSSVSLGSGTNRIEGLSLYPHFSNCSIVIVVHFGFFRPSSSTSSSPESEEPSSASTNLHVYRHAKRNDRV